MLYLCSKFIVPLIKMVMNAKEGSNKGMHVWIKKIQKYWEGGKINPNGKYHVHPTNHVSPEQIIEKIL